MFIVFLIILFVTDIASLDNGIRENICVEDKEYIEGKYINGTHISPRAFFYSKGERYEIAQNILSTAKDQYYEIQVGDIIEVTYVVQSDITGEYRFVIDAKKSDGTVLVDYDSYSSEQNTGRTIFLISYLLVQLLLIGLSVFYFYTIK